jgi:dihydrofolate reductase
VQGLFQKVKMRRIRYSVATSLDGFIAGPDGESDWIIMDPEIDFAAMFSEFDTALMGRRTYEVVAGSRQWLMDNAMKLFVVSKTLRQSEHPKVTVISENLTETLTALREAPGKNIWLMGGGSLFSSLAAAGLVDTVEITMIPILLGAGVPLVSQPSGRVKLTLTGERIYRNSGIISLTYAVNSPAES